jgi:predicted Zn-dependent peptidase
MVDIRDGNFSTDEFERAKWLVYNRVKTRFQLPGDYLSWYVDEYLYDKPFLDIQKTLDTIQNFPRERISQVAKKFIKNDNWSLTIRWVEINAEDYRNIVMKYL